MRMNRLVTTLVIAHAVQAAAQVKACIGGPGASFGITGYSCASCAVARTADTVHYSFDTEPVVNAVSATSPFLPGDVIVSVNGQPITTKQGGHDFAAPSPGRHTVYFRRWDG